MKRPIVSAMAFLLTVAGPCQALDMAALEPLVECFLWGDASDSERARRQLAEQEQLQALSKAEFETFENYLRQARPLYPSALSGADVHRFAVTLPDGRALPVQIISPPNYAPETTWPVILAMHGGPNRHRSDAGAGAVHMADLWKKAAADAGWLVVAPAMIHVIVRGPRTDTRLPYEIMTATQMEALMNAVAARYNVNSNRVVATGVSLGANFSIAYAAARPDRFSAIAPASSEGEAREHLIRNLALVPSYALQGGLDRNVRARAGPRILASIQRRFGQDYVYREFEDRGHESFSQVYPEVLEWLAVRPRDPYPKEVLRVPHTGIMPTAKRIHWLQVDNHQALVNARIESGNRIVLTAWRTRQITLYLHDRLVDLDRPVEVILNGFPIAPQSPQRSVLFALEQRQTLSDPERVYAAAITVDVPDSQASLDAGRALEASIAPNPNNGVLSYWESFALQTLKDRFPNLGIEGLPTALPAELAGVPEGIAFRLTSIEPDGPFGGIELREGDLVLSVNNEMFFDGNELDALYDWLLRDLTSAPQSYRLKVWRDGTIVEQHLDLALTPLP